MLWLLVIGRQMCLFRVKESATVTEITDSYRKLAKEWHPDKNKHRRAEAEAQFAAISHAYGILKNDDSRRDYNYALRHPEEFAYNHARYYYTQYYTRHFKVCKSLHRHMCALFAVPIAYIPV